MPVPDLAETCLVQYCRGRDHGGIVGRMSRRVSPREITGGRSTALRPFLGVVAGARLMLSRAGDRDRSMCNVQDWFL